MLATRDQRSASPPIVIVGGSLAALMAGIVLIRLGHKVEILEQNESSTREESGAGITMGARALEFFERFDRNVEPHTVPCPGVNYFDKNSKVKKVWERPMQMSSWNSLYYRLRANFDGHTNCFCPNPPTPMEHHGEGAFQLGARVTGISLVGKPGNVVVKYTNTITGTEKSIVTDQVIVADGASSSMRQLLLPSSERKYSGYFAWRGLVDEMEMTDEERRLLTPSFSAFKYRGGYIMCYIVPGDNGNIKPGHRRFNWVWYVQCPKDSPWYKEALTDTDGHQHRNSIPKGRISPSVWKQQLAHGKSVLNSIFLQLLSNTKEPFLSVIHDYASSQASFMNGKVLLIGDALATFRPHMGAALNQAAVDCLVLEKLARGEIKVEEWEKIVVQHGQQNRALNAAFGIMNIYGVISLKFWAGLVGYFWSLMPLQWWIRRFF
ncbi:hypothetical protein BGZ60DRAFT_431892 [Tricladium varicosporioides]|nr:hypothetical protein BGZ60DRAFT_431892 [Hymenoscyphus varicosporioides]